jgi:alkanesulfonate monooxygenase SsuD/methylene tetrahydromethanopterin reductase-like flavin-dependent oxidoreductase (luciferase family)
MASHEQVSATDLLTDVIAMEENELERCWVSDHYMPWWHDGGFAGATWPWLGAALAKTNKINIGTAVTAPILRYHPAIVAQVFATLGYMFPERVFLTVGTGEAIMVFINCHGCLISVHDIKLLTSSDLWNYVF